MFPHQEQKHHLQYGQISPHVKDRNAKQHIFRNALISLPFHNKNKQKRIQLNIHTSKLISRPVSTSIWPQRWQVLVQQISPTCPPTSCLFSWILFFFVQAIFSCVSNFTTLQTFFSTSCSSLIHTVTKSVQPSEIITTDQLTPHTHVDCVCLVFKIVSGYKAVTKKCMKSKLPQNCVVIDAVQLTVDSKF